MNKSPYEEFIRDSYCLLSDYNKKNRYFHRLTPYDNAPLVVHKKTNQLTYVIKGNGEIYLDGKRITLSENQSVFIKNGTKHKIVASSDELILFHIHIPDEGRDNDRFIIEGNDYDRFNE